MESSLQYCQFFPRMNIFGHKYSILIFKFNIEYQLWPFSEPIIVTNLLINISDQRIFSKDNLVRHKTFGCSWIRNREKWGVYLQFATPEANPCFILLKNQRFIVETGTP